MCARCNTRHHRNARCRRPQPPPASSAPGFLGSFGSDPSGFGGVHVFRGSGGLGAIAQARYSVNIFPGSSPAAIKQALASVGIGGDRVQSGRVEKKKPRGRRSGKGRGAQAKAEQAKKREEKEKQEKNEDEGPRAEESNPASEKDASDTSSEGGIIVDDDGIRPPFRKRPGKK